MPLTEDVLIQRPKELLGLPVVEVLVVETLHASLWGEHHLVFFAVQFLPYPKKYVYLADEPLFSLPLDQPMGPETITWINHSLNLHQGKKRKNERVSKAFAFPSKHTFTLQPVKALLNRYIDLNEIWLDPFAGEFSPLRETNDINPKKPALYHMDALAFVKRYPVIDGCLFDPPYSPRQAKEAYESAGLKFTKEMAQGYSAVKDELARRIRTFGIAISFGWSANGFGKQRGFRTLETLIIPHGGNHNATICVVEEKTANKIEAPKPFTILMRDETSKTLIIKKVD